MDCELKAVLEDIVSFDNHVDQLRKTVRTQGLSFLKDPEEENSLFHALGHQLQQLDRWCGSHIDLVKEIVHYFRGNIQYSKDEVKQEHDVQDDLECTAPEIHLFNDNEILEAVSCKFQKQVKVYHSSGKVDVVGSYEDEQPVLLGRLQENKYVGLQSSFPCDSYKDCVSMTSTASDDAEHTSKKRHTKPRPKKKKNYNKIRKTSSSYRDKVSKDKSPFKLLYPRDNNITKSPGWAKSDGVLCRTSQYNVHIEIKQELSKVLKLKGPSAFMEYLNTKFAQMRRNNDDMAVATLIQGYLCTFQLTFNMKQSHSHLKMLEKSIDKYNFKHRNIIYALLYHTFFINYAVKRKFGKANIYILKAHEYICMECPDTWTSGIFHIRAWMLNIFGYMKPELREKYSEEAVKLYRLARDHCLYQSCSRDTNDYYFIHYTMQMVYISLLMPTLYTISIFPFSDIILDHGRKGLISEQTIQNMKQMISLAKQKLDKLTKKHRFKETEMILIGEIFLSIKSAQLAIASEEYNEAKKCIQIGIDLHNEWCFIYRTGSSYTYLKRLKKDLWKLLEELLARCEKVKCNKKVVKKDQKQSRQEDKVLVYERVVTAGEICFGVLTSADESEAGTAQMDSDVL